MKTRFLSLSILVLTLGTLAACFEQHRPQAKPSAGGGSGGSGGGAGSGAAANAANASAAIGQLSIAEGPEEIEKALDLVGVTFELETISGGQGAPSYFGSGVSGASSNSLHYINKERAQLKELSAALADPAVVEFMVKHNIARVFVQNPYEHQNQNAYVYVYQRAKYGSNEEVLGFSVDSSLVVDLGADRDLILTKLQKFKLEEPMIPGFSIFSPEEDDDSLIK